MSRNPHIDDGRVLWDDNYSGEYEPVVYSEQFDDQWRLFLEKKPGFYHHAGVETADAWIDERILELTGVTDFLLRKKWKLVAPIIKRYRQLKALTQEKLVTDGGVYLSPKFDSNYFQNKRCLDAGCGAGRWSKVLQSLGAEVTAIDVSTHGLRSTRNFLNDVRELSIFDIPVATPTLHNIFDFAICWGVIMCTHNPKLAFENVASTVKKGGSMYIMVYAPTYHNSEKVLSWRKEYRETCKSFDEKLAFAYAISENKANVIGYLDMLNTFYNWVIDEKTIINWFERNGFHDIVFLNKNEPHKCAHHVIAKK